MQGEILDGKICESKVLGEWSIRWIAERLEHSWTLVKQRRRS